MKVPWLQIVLVCCCFWIFTSQAQWVPVAPQWGSYGLYDVHFKDQNGVAVGQKGLITTSTDSGFNWTIRPHASGYELSRIGYAGGDTYYACGEKGEVIRSSNLGHHWSRTPVPSAETLNSISFINTQTGWVAGENGGLFKTVNGGVTWQKNDSIQSGTQGIAYVKFFNDTAGVVVFRNGTAKRTTNGGLTWLSYATGLSNVYVRDASFTSLTRGCFLWGYQFHTVVSMRQTMNGNTFSDITSYTCIANENLSRIIMMNDSSMYLLNNFNMAAYSTNSAATWNKEYFSGLPYAGPLIFGYFFPNRAAIVLMAEGYVLRRAAHGGWTNLREAPPVPVTTNYWTLSDLLYQDTLHAVGMYRDLNRTLFLRSANGGKNWDITDTVTPATLYYSRASANKVYMLTTNGQVYKSTDTGSTWSSTNTCPCKTTTQQVVSYRFFDDTGYLFCSDKSLYYTTNSGLSWNLRSSTPSFTQVVSVNSTKWFALSNSSIKGSFYLYRSANAGISWDSVSLNGVIPGADFSAGIYAMQDSILFMTAQYRDNAAPFYKTIHRLFRSSNDGNTWKEMSVGGPRKSGDVLTVPYAPAQFTSSGGSVWMWGYNGNYPVFHSPDAGVNWYAQYPKVYMEFPFVHALNSNTAYATFRDLIISKANNAGLLPMPAKPAVVSNQLTFSQIAHQSMRVHWQRKSCDKYLLLISNKPISVLPLHAAEYGTGYDMGDSAVVAYVGEDTTVWLTGLQPDTTYHFSLFHYNGSDHLAHYQTGLITQSQQRTFNAPVITSVSRTVFCTGDSIYVNFTSSIPFTDSVTYRLYLSNESGIIQVPNGMIAEIKTNVFSGKIGAKIPVSGLSQSYIYRVAVAAVLAHGIYTGEVSPQLSIAWRPVIGIATTDTLKCTLNKGFELSHTGSMVSTTTRLWKFPGGTTATQTPVMYNDSLPGTKQIKLLVTNRGCTDSASRNIYIYSPKTPRLNQGAISYLCTGDSRIITDTAIIPQARYSWYRNGGLLGSISNSTTVTQAGFYYCETRDEDSTCLMRSDTVVVASLKRPALTYQVLKGPVICDGDSAVLKVTSDTNALFRWQQDANTIAFDTVSFHYPKSAGVWRVQAVHLIDSSCVSPWAGNTSIVVNVSPPAVQIQPTRDTLFSSINSSLYYYRWYRNDTALNEFLWYTVPKISGSYQVELKSIKGCISFSTPVQFTYSPGTNVNGISQEYIQVFPNPFSEWLTVASDKLDRVRIVDARGSLVAQLYPQRNTEQWNLSHLPSGFYTLQLILKNGAKEYRKIIKAE